MRKSGLLASVASSIVWVAGCATPSPRPIATRCPAPTPIPEALATRPSGSMQEQLRLLYLDLLGSAPDEQTSSPPR